MSAFRHSLDPIFRPRSVAVLGASATPGSVGSILMRNLLGHPFGGVVYPVNPKRRAVQGVYCYPDLTAVPEVVDLAIIATPAASVPSLVADCIRRGVPAAIIISAGFSELGAEGRELEQQIQELARGRIRILGPNCLGVIHPLSNLNASFAADMPRSGQVALLSQSGAICAAILDWARGAHVGFSSFVSVGSMIDIDFAELIDYFADDTTTRGIILYMESMGDVRAFLSAARSASRTKQVIVVKSGRFEASARAAASHTGALAGSDAVFEAAFRRAGVLRVNTIPDLFNMSEILAMQPPPRGPALAVITNAGGPGVMAIDALMGQGGQLAALSHETLTALNAVLPPFWSHANPIDILGDARPELYRAAVETCLRDGGVQGLLVILSPQAMTDPTETARLLVPFAHSSGKPLLACWLGGESVRAGRDLLGRAGIPTFDSPEAAIQAFLHMVQYRRNQELLYERPAATAEDWKPDSDKARQLLQHRRAAQRTLLNEAEAKELLSAYDVPVVPTVACATMNEAVAAARRIGYPVVVKLLSSQITHKSEVGGVRLGLNEEADVCAAFEGIRDNLQRRKLAEAFEGVTVQPMILDRGYELIIGSSVDHQFGPVILFGAGGILVEVFQDHALALPPLNRTLARRLMERTRIYQALQGVRGQKPVQLEVLENLLERFSRLLVDFPEIKEVDLNPVLATSERILVLDARVVLFPGDMPPEQLPRLAIRPYPNQYITPFTMRDGTAVVIRPIRPEDETLIVDLHGRHSERTIRMRYFSLVKILSRDNLIRLCHLDYDREMALTAVLREGEQTRILGVSRYHLIPGTGTAEFALIVEDAHQGKGLGRHLLERLIVLARERGLKKLVGQVLRENSQMLSLTAGLGFTRSSLFSGDDDVVQVELELN